MVIDPGGICKHGNRHWCGLCAAEKAPKCKHGNAFYCGLCATEKQKQHNS